MTKEPAYVKERGIDLYAADCFKMIPGKGIDAVVDGRRILCGNSAYLEENGVLIGEFAVSSLELFRNQGKAAILVSCEGACIGIVALGDTLRSDAKDMVRELRAANTDVVLLTGDHVKTTEFFAGQVGIGSVYADLLPAGKVEKIHELQKQGRSICMAGDGVNDAPALKAADVGVAMGSMGSDIAIEAADIAKIPYLKRLSNATVKLVKFNISLSMCINFIAIILSVLAVLGPISGALVHNAGSVLVVLNAALLYDRKF